MRETLCYEPCFISHHLIVLVPFLEKNPFESHRENTGRCGYCFSEYLSFVKRGNFCLDCILPFRPVGALLALNDRSWIMISEKGICNLFSKIYVDSHRLTIKILQNRYSWWKFPAPLVTLRDFPIRSSLGVPMSQSVCAQLRWVVEVVLSLGVYYPFVDYQR